MQILQLSDLHFGFDNNTHRILDKFFKNLPDADAIVICGDLASHRPHQLESCLRYLRKHWHKPIMAVLGNHDLWQDVKRDRFKSTDSIVRSHLDAFAQHEVAYLHDNHVVLNDILFCGFDGWYREANPPSNDSSRIAMRDPFLMHKLASRSFTAFSNVLNTAQSFQGRKVIATHHNLLITDMLWRGMAGNTALPEPICENFDLLMYGHTHERLDTVRGKCRIVNCGSDYNKPQYKLIAF